MMKINLKNIASFGETPITLETDKRNNLVYGLNGTGKTTLSDFLYFREREQKFNDCTLEGVNNEKILVYNQSFIQDNFYKTDELKGIFTLSQKNKEAEKSIEEISQKKKEKEKEKTEIEGKKAEYQNEKNQKLETIRDAIWKIKTTYTGGDRVLAFCLEGLQRKERLFDYLTQIQKPAAKPSVTIETLKGEAQSLIAENAQKYDELQPVNISVESVEQSDIWSEVIVGNEDIPVASLIKKLNNSDWVKRGLDYLPGSIEDAEKCPFCQQETITEQVAQSIRLYFDETYEQKIESIKKLETEYEEALLPAIENYRDHALLKESKDQFEKIHAELQNLLNHNKSQIENKLKEPNQKIILTDTKSKLAELNDLISTVNEKIQHHNERIDNKAQTKKEINNKFWQVMRWEYDDRLTQYYTENKNLDGKIKKLIVSFSTADREISVHEQEIVKQQKNMVNIEEAIQNINKGLDELGIEGFSIKKYQNNSYKIVREGQTREQFSTLSEGEKMIISFLYFVELCKGKESEEEMEREKIVVIDDPVSSLSHTYVFNLSQWVKNHFFDNSYKQVFVLTHSLYFFHQLIRQGKDKKLFRLTKSSSTGSQIQTMEQDEIKNEYESYWQVIKDHDCLKASDALLANSMRNILEHFFGFIDKAKLPESLQKLGEDGDFAPFLQYMNKESHSGAINITDNKELDPTLFKKAFKNVFSES